MLYFLVYPLIVVAAASGAFAAAAYGAHRWLNVAIVAGLPTVAYLCLFAWTYTWMRNAPIAAWRPADNREFTIVVVAVFAGAMLAIALTIIGAFAELGYALSPRRRRASR